MFNPNPRIQVIPIGTRHACYVIDDALREPQRWVDEAASRFVDFDDSPHNVYPGPELRMPDEISAQLDHYFALHMRGRLGARRTLRMYSRLSLATRAPQQLRPMQWLCHVDRLEVEPGQCLAASVLYLFKDPALGGTSFYAPRRPLPEIARLIQASATLPAEEFTARHGVRPGYMTRSNEWFEKLATVPARWNRLIFYDGGLFHSGEITSPEKLLPDPRAGRLTLNGFFICRRALAASRAAASSTYKLP
ncbi:MAG: DUF6445 family protein [Pseudomonadota bacterium]|nr:DUF6445 family protein [Pseudomonadota bacterium]